VRSVSGPDSQRAAHARRGNFHCAFISLSSSSGPPRSNGLWFAGEHSPTSASVSGPGPGVPTVRSIGVAHARNGSGSPYDLRRGAAGRRLVSVCSHAAGRLSAVRGFGLPSGGREGKREPWRTYTSSCPGRQPPDHSFVTGTTPSMVRRSSLTNTHAVLPHTEHLLCVDMLPGWP